MTLELPRQPWFWQDRTERRVLHAPSGPVNERHIARMTAAKALAAEVEALLDPKLAEAARQAKVANSAVGAELNSALAELDMLSSDAAGDDLDSEAMASMVVRRMVVEQQVPTLRRRLAKTQQQAEQSVSIVRETLRTQAERGMLTRERARLTALRAQVEELEQQIGDGEIALIEARGVLARWGDD